MDCKDLLARPEWEIQILHIYREANMAANLGVDENRGLNCFFDPSSSLYAVIVNDLAGLARTRLIKE